LFDHGLKLIAQIVDARIRFAFLPQAAQRLRKQQRSFIAVNLIPIAPVGLGCSGGSIAFALGRFKLRFYLSGRQEHLHSPLKVLPFHVVSHFLPAAQSFSQKRLALQHSFHSKPADLNRTVLYQPQLLAFDCLLHSHFRLVRRVAWAQQSDNPGVLFAASQKPGLMRYFNAAKLIAGR
jgi:hypothetical protein